MVLLALSYIGIGGLISGLTQIGGPTTKSRHEHQLSLLASVSNCFPTAFRPTNIAISTYPRAPIICPTLSLFFCTPGIAAPAVDETANIGRPGDVSLVMQVGAKPM